jgi:hypothetical protein
MHLVGRELKPSTLIAAIDCGKATNRAMLGTAERLNPVSVTPLYLQASAPETAGDREGARSALQEPWSRIRATRGCRS